MPVVARSTPRGKRPRRAAAAVELALLLPVLVLLLVAAIDFGRLYYDGVTISTCARNGALWASDPATQPMSPYANVQQAAQADAPNLSPTPTATAGYSTSPTGPFSLNSPPSGDGYVQVTVTWNFQPLMPAALTQFAGISSPVQLSRSVRMRIAPNVPN